MIRIATPAFIEHGSCASTDPEAYFPENGGSNTAAKRTCLACDVRAECLAWALENDERFGVWGGLSESERRRIRKGEPRRVCELGDCDVLLPLGSAGQRRYCSTICQSRAREERRAARQEAVA